MNKTQLIQLMQDSLQVIIEKSLSSKEINKINKRHQEKVHFIPMKYRVIGGFLQSLNIKFGNYIEFLIPQIAKQDGGLDILDVSGSKNVKLSINNQTDDLINQYITQRQAKMSLRDYQQDFENLLKGVFESEKNNPATDNIITHDLDILFQRKNEDIFHYIEVKYNDDHDTGKFENINTKFLKTYAGLINYLKIDDYTKLVPHIYYFNQHIKKINHFVYEDTHILRGGAFFDLFLGTSYTDIDDCLRAISDDEKTLAIFDKFYNQIRYDK